MSPRTAILLAWIFALSPWLSAAMQPLAQDFVVVGRSPSPKTVPLHNPSLVALPDGRLAAAHVLSGKNDKAYTSATHVLTSDDHGITWQHRAAVPKLGQARLIVANGVLYLVGTGNTMNISKSIDRGETWSAPVPIAEGPWHQSATNFIRAKGNIYLALEKRAGKEIDGWLVGELSPILMRAKETDDLTLPQSWTFSQEFPFRDVIPGYRENDAKIDCFGVPFFPQNFPNRTVLTPKGVKPVRSDSPMGWLEANVARIEDPDHYWFDPAGNTIHILLRAHTGGTGYAALVKVTENADGSMTTSLESAPSGKKILFLPMPGGQMRFHIVYDEETRLYWLRGSQATDSMTRAEKLPPERFGLPNNERHRMVLYFSKNLVDWCFAGLVAMGPNPGESRHYAAMDIDGDDLVILSRSGDADAKSAHDTNIITFHRVKNFRGLVY